jgi:hypothetical protein
VRHDDRRHPDTDKHFDRRLHIGMAILLKMQRLMERSSKARLQHFLGGRQWTTPTIQITATLLVVGTT